MSSNTEIEISSIENDKIMRISLVPSPVIIKSEFVV